jgi:hypothetical protein
MSNHHRTPHLTQRLLCDSFAPLLPLLSLDALDQEAEATLTRHVATCEYCQRETAIYGDLSDAIRRQLVQNSPEDHDAPRVLRDASRRAADWEEDAPLVFDTPAAGLTRPNVPTSWRERFSVPVPQRRMGVVNVFEALAAVLVIALIATLLASHRLPGPATAPTKASPTATQDPLSQAYVDLLREYYVPLAEANTPALTCALNVLPSQSASDLAACQSPIQTEQAAAQVLSAHLASATPPPRWQTQHTTLTVATQGIVTWTTTQLQAIEAQNVARFVGNSSPVLDEGTAFCDPIAQINAGPPRVSPPLVAMMQAINAGGISCAS